MTKLNSNNRITESNIYGRVIQHDLYLDQAVTSLSSPTFGSIFLNGDAIIQGNLTVNGNTSVLDTLFTQFYDNILLINALETGAGVTLNEAGLEVARGSFPSFRMVYTENTGGATSISGGTFRIGLVGDTQSVATRQDNPLNDGVMVWNNSEYRLDSVNDITIDMTFSSTTANLGLTTGAVVFEGGLIMKQDVLVYDTLFLGTQGNQLFSETNGTLNITSVNDISLNPTGDIVIPSNTDLYLGNTKIVSDSIGNLEIDTGTIGNINITTANINIPQNSTISLGTSTLVSDGISDLRLTSDNNVYIIPTSGQSVVIPNSSPLVLGNATEQISGTATGDVSLLASNNITLTPTVSVRIPTDIPIRFGGSGNQKVSSNASNELVLQATTNIRLNPGNGINVTAGTKINMGDAYFSGTLTDASGNAGYIEMNKLRILDTSSNSIISLGTINSVGIVTTDVNTSTISFNSGHIVSETSNTLQLSIPSTKSLTFGSDHLVIDEDSGLTSIGSLVTESIIADNLTISGITLFSNTLDVTNPTTASIVSSGGIVVGKKLRVGSDAFISNGLDMNNSKITNVDTPTAPNDAVNLAYVSTLTQGLSWKEAVEAATTTQGTLSTDFDVGKVIDGYTLLLDDRILLKNQADPIENGVYIVQATGAPVRTVDFAIGYEASGYSIFANQGTLNEELGFLCTSDKPNDVVGTDALTFIQFTALGQITAGDGLLKNLNNIYVNVDDTSIEIFSDQVRIKNTALGTGLTGGSGVAITTTPDQSHVTQLGTITTGVWNAAIGTVPYGFTGQSSFTLGNILLGNGTDALVASEKLYFNPTTGSLGIGTSAPAKTVHITHKEDSHVLISADSDGINPTNYPLVKLEASNVADASLAIARSDGNFMTGVYQNSTVLFGSGNIQIGSNNELLSTWTTEGNIGFGTNNPNEFFTVNGITNVIDSTVSTGQTDGALVVYGDSSFVGKVNFNDDITVFNSVNTLFSGPVSAASLTVTGTNGNTVVISGKSLINDSTESISTTDGSIVTIGGVGIGKDITLGGSLITKEVLFHTSASFLMSTGSLYLKAGTTGSLTMASNGNLNVHQLTIFDTTVTASTNLDVLGTSTINELNVTTFRPDTNGLFTRINNTAGSSLWVYLGQITQVSGTISDIEFGFNSPNYEYGLTNSILTRNSNVFVYNDTTNDHLFLLLGANATEDLYITSSDSLLTVNFEGTGANPDASTSGYTGTWTNVLNTNVTEENITKKIGGITINDTFVSYDYIPKVSSIGTNTGITYKLHQNETTSFASVFTDALPDQSTATSVQVKFTAAASSVDDFYIGYIVDVNGEVREIIDYNGAQRVATINAVWLTQPVETDTADLYDHQSVSLYYNNTEGSITVSYATINGQDLVPNSRCNMIFADGTVGNIIGEKIDLTNTNGYSLLTQGDISCQSNINADILRLGTVSTTENIINIRETTPVISIQSTDNSYSGIDFSFDTLNTHFGVIATPEYLGLTSTATDQSINTSTLGLVQNTNGNIGIKTTDISTELTLVSGSIISIDSTSGHLHINGGSNDSASNLILTAVGNTESNFATLETDQFNVNTLDGDQLSSLNTAGYLIFTNMTTNSGIMITDTRNATDYTVGNALTSRGGGAIEKDLYIGGSLYVAGATVVAGVNTSPTLIFSNAVNCTVTNDDNVQLVLIGTEYMLSFYTEVTPTAGNFACSFEFTIPNRTTNFAAKSDVICMVSGYTSTDVVLFNTLGRGITASTDAKVMFQSSDTSTHTLQILARYTNI